MGVTCHKATTVSPSLEVPRADKIAVQKTGGSCEGGVGAVGLPDFKEFSSRVMEIFWSQIVAVP